MNFSALSIKNPVPAIMLFVLLTLAGLLAYKANKVQDFPDIELPIVTVTAALDGAAPAQLETEVARKIEDSVATLQGVKNIYTKVLDGVATVTVEFILEKDIAEAVNDVRDAVARVKADLPAEMRDPTVTKASTAGRVVLTFIATRRRQPRRRQARRPGSELVRRQRRRQAPAQRARRGRGQAGRRRVPRSARRTRRRAHGGAEGGRRSTSRASCAACSAKRRAAAATSAAPSSRCAPSPPSRRAAELAALDIPLPDGRRVRLDQVANVTDTVAEPRSLAEQDGKRVVGFEVFRTKGASEVDVAQRRARRHRRAAEGARQHRAQGSDRQRRAGGGELRRLDGAAVRRRAAGGAGGVVVPARLARHAGGGRRAAAVGDPGLPRPVPVRLHAQHRDPAVAGAGGRACWSTMRSSRSRTSRATCAWARRRCRRRWKRPTKSAWR